MSKQKSGKREVPEADAPLFAALVEWRRKLSRASGAPAYVVFHDTTLAAIASARPRTPGRVADGPGRRAGEGRALRRRGAVAGRRARERPADPRCPLTSAPLGVDDGGSGPQRRCESGGGRKRKEPGDAPIDPAAVPDDDEWPYPEVARLEPVVDDVIDLDALELRCDPHAYADLTELEHYVVTHRYGLDCPVCSMKELARELECTHAEARECSDARSTSSGRASPSRSCS